MKLSTETDTVERSNDAAPHSLINSIISAIQNNADFSLAVPEHLRYVLRAMHMTPNGRSEMLKGIAGLPRTSKQMVELGVFYIDGNFVCLHRDIFSALEAKDAKRDALIKRLQQYAAGTPLTEAELAGFL